MAAIVYVLSFALLLVRDIFGLGDVIREWIVIGVSLSLVAGLTFWAFYYREGEAPMRLALTVAIVATYFLLISHLIVNPAFRAQLETPAAVGQESDAGGSTTDPETVASTPLGVTIVNGFTGLVGTVIAFFFASQAVERVGAAVGNGIAGARTTVVEDPTAGSKAAAPGRPEDPGG